MDLDARQPCGGFPGESGGVVIGDIVILAVRDVEDIDRDLPVAAFPADPAVEREG
jgi:hypothetical protein